MNKSIVFLLFTALAFSFCSPCWAAEELEIRVSGQEAGLTFQMLDDGRLLVSAKVTMVGHTDSIGKELYNIDLSMRRAKAAYEEILAGGVPQGEAISYAGAGPHDPLFDNTLPEGRALNRTVTVSLEYEQK